MAAMAQPDKLYKLRWAVGGRYSYVMRIAASTGSMQEGHVNERMSQSSIHSLW